VSSLLIVGPEVLLEQLFEFIKAKLDTICDVCLRPIFLLFYELLNWNAPGVLFFP